MVRGSIARTLSLGFAAVGLIGIAILLTTIVIDYHLTFGGLERPGAFAKALFEVQTHVLLPAVVIVLPMALVGHLVVRRAIKPIKAAALEVAQTPTAQLGQRIDGRNFPAEIAPLADGVNGLLARMEQIAKENGSFAADVAHELRTPLTLLGLELERLDHPLAESLSDQVKAMQKLVNQLMSLARLEAAGNRLSAMEPVDLSMVAANVVATMAPSALTHGRMLEVENLGGGVIAGQDEAICAALRNLIENAIRATPVGGTVSVIVGPGPSLAVADGGAGLDEEALDKLTRRHARADNASQDGAGLGLAIVAKIVQQHRAHLTTDREMRRISIVFPTG